MVEISTFKFNAYPSNRIRKRAASICPPAHGNTHILGNVSEGQIAGASGTNFTFTYFK